MKRLLIAALLVLVPTIAVAHTWYFYNPTNGTCVNSILDTPPFTSPSQLRSFARTQPNYRGFKTKHVDGGIIEMINLGRKGGFFAFTSTLPLCQDLIKEINDVKRQEP